MCELRFPRKKQFRDLQFRMKKSDVFVEHDSVCRCSTSLTHVSPAQLVCHPGVKQHDSSAALQDCNRSKNRSCSMIPGECQPRVLLVSC